MKVAIIGAGIVGLYLAKNLSEIGHEVEVFEKRNAVGKEACSGLFSERIFEFIPQSKKLVQNEINFVLIHFPQKTVRVDFIRKFFIMSHAELDRLAADLAQNSGVKINLGRDMAIHSVLPTRLSPLGSARGSGSPHPNPSVHSHIASSSESEFGRVIGCDGANSEVRKYLKLPEPKYRLGILGFVPVKDFSNYVETWPIKNGFVWKIPRGNEIEYGIISGLNDARKLFDDFCSKNSIEISNIKSALIPQGFIIPKNDKITLCGDSAGLTKPWSGGGVVWGLTAADILLKNFPNMLKYRQKAGRFFLPEIVLSKIASKIVYFLGFNFPRILPSKAKMEGDYAFGNHYGRKPQMGQR